MDTDVMICYIYYKRRETNMFTLPKLAYGYDALEPYIDSRTMEIHHTKHHQAYIDKLNSVVGKYPELAGKTAEDLLRSLQSLNVSDSDRELIRNHGGGHANHTFFWKVMDPSGKKDTDTIARIRTTFGSVDAFRETFEGSAMNRFGSGWAWLVEKPDRSLAVYSTANQDSPYLSGDVPILGIDVWEHAYYLGYQNRRAEYVKNWWNTVKLL
jgi:Fe-Mn family superoxide dismutase